MREASLQAYAVSQAAKRAYRKFCSFHSLLLNFEIHAVASFISCFLSFHLENSKSQRTKRTSDGEDDGEERPAKRERINIVDELQKRRQLKEKEIELRERELKLPEAKEARAVKEWQEEQEERKMLVNFLMKNA